MITDAVIEAVDLAAASCSDDQQRLGILSIREMLCDFSEDEWTHMEEKDRAEWIAQFLSCVPNGKEE